MPPSFNQELLSSDFRTSGSTSFDDAIKIVDREYCYEDNNRHGGEGVPICGQTETRGVLPDDSTSYYDGSLEDQSKIYAFIIFNSLLFHTCFIIFNIDCDIYARKLHEDLLNFGRTSAIFYRTAENRKRSGYMVDFVEKCVTKLTKGDQERLSRLNKDLTQEHKIRVIYLVLKHGWDFVLNWFCAGDNLQELVLNMTDEEFKHRHVIEVACILVRSVELYASQFEDDVYSFYHRINNLVNANAMGVVYNDNDNNTNTDSNANANATNDSNANDVKAPKPHIMASAATSTNVSDIVGTASVGDSPKILMDRAKTFRLTFHNFNGMKHARGEYLSPPPFEAYGYLWKFRLYPKGNQQSDNDTEVVSCFLECMEDDKDVPAPSARMTFRCKEYKKSFATCVYRINMMRGVNNYLKRGDVLEHYLEEDGSLIIEVDVRITVDSKRVTSSSSSDNTTNTTNDNTNINNSSSSSSNNNNNNNNSDPAIPPLGRALASLGADSLRFVFNDFTGMKQARGDCLISPSIEASGYLWRLRFYPKGNEQPDTVTDTGYISVYLKYSGDEQCTPSAKCTFRCKDVTVGVITAFFDNKLAMGQWNFLKREDVLENYLEEDGSLIIEVDVRITVETLRFVFPNFTKGMEEGRGKVEYLWELNFYPKDNQNSDNDTEHGSCFLTYIGDDTYRPSAEITFRRRVGQRRPHQIYHLKREDVVEKYLEEDGSLIIEVPLSSTNNFLEITTRTSAWPAAWAVAVLFLIISIVWIYFSPIVVIIIGIGIFMSWPAAVLFLIISIVWIYFSPIVVIIIGIGIFMIDISDRENILAEYSRIIQGCWRHLLSCVSVIVDVLETTTRTSAWPSAWTVAVLFLIISIVWICFSPSVGIIFGIFIIDTSDRENILADYSRIIQECWRHLLSYDSVIVAGLKRITFYFNPLPLVTMVFEWMNRGCRQGWGRWLSFSRTFSSHLLSFVRPLVTMVSEWMTRASSASISMFIRWYWGIWLPYFSVIAIGFFIIKILSFFSIGINIAICMTPSSKHPAAYCYATDTTSQIIMNCTCVAAFWVTTLFVMMPMSARFTGKDICIFGVLGSAFVLFLFFSSVGINIGICMGVVAFLVTSFFAERVFRFLVTFFDESTGLASPGRTTAITGYDWTVAGAEIFSKNILRLTGKDILLLLFIIGIENIIIAFSSSIVISNGLGIINIGIGIIFCLRSLKSILCSNDDDDDDDDGVTREEWEIMKMLYVDWHHLQFFIFTGISITLLTGILLLYFGQSYITFIAIFLWFGIALALTTNDVFTKQSISYYFDTLFAVGIQAERDEWKNKKEDLLRIVISGPGGDPVYYKTSILKGDTFKGPDGRTFYDVSIFDRRDGTDFMEMVTRGEIRLGGNVVCKLSETTFSTQATAEDAGGFVGDRVHTSQMGDINFEDNRGIVAMVVGTAGPILFNDYVNTLPQNLEVPQLVEFLMRHRADNNDDAVLLQNFKLVAVVFDKSRIDGILSLCEEGDDSL